MKEGKLRDILDEVGVVPIHLNRRGWLVCECPFAPHTHEYGTDSSPSFFFKVNPEGYSGFNCFTCHQHGNLTQFLERLAYYRDEDYSDLVTRAFVDETPDSFIDWEEAREEAFNSVEEVPELDAQIYERLYPEAWSKKAGRNYLVGREIGEESSGILGLRWDPDEERILFPVMGYERQLYGFTGRTTLHPNLWPGKRYPKVRDYAGLKKEQLILGEHMIDKGEGNQDAPLLVVEGLFALATMVELGVDEFCNPVATMGSYLSEAQRDILIDYDRAVYLLYDLDEAGEEGLWGTRDKAGKFEGGGAVDLLRKHVPTYTCLYPDDVDDPDDLEYEEVESMVCGEDNQIQ